MRPEELRIGNLVEYNGLPWRVSGIHSPGPLKDKRFSDKWVIELFDGYAMINVTIDEVKAIPISEEWLDRFLFTKNGNEYTFEDWYLGISFDAEYNDWHLYELRDNFWIKTIKYIHSLQNYYTESQDKELTLTK